MDTDRLRTGGGVPREKVRPPAPFGIHRTRLTERLLDAPAGLRLVVGPAGSGKTTALAHAAHAFDGRCVWVSLDGTDRRSVGLMRTLATATGPGLAGADPLAVVAELDDGCATLVVFDDVHEVAGSAAVEVIDLLCRYRPPQVTVVLGARDLRELRHWRWRTDPEARVLGVDELRFRLWEVDELFRHLDARLAPSEVHTLAHRTDGWAVALRLFHVALRDSGGDATSLLARSPRLTHRSIRGYLREEVLSRIDVGEQEFLRRTAVLDRLQPTVCDQLLDRVGSQEVLEDMAGCGLLLVEHDGSSYRLHELLRQHLLGELASSEGDEAVAELHRRAARLHERRGAISDASRAAARGGDWDHVRRLLRRQPPERGTARSAPAVDADPWILRAEAIRRLGEGDLAAAEGVLRVAVERFDQSGGHAGTDRLLRLTNAWLRPGPSRSPTWVSALRQALAGEEPVSWGHDQGSQLARGVAELAHGRWRVAEDAFAGAAEGPQPVLRAMAAVGAAAIDRLRSREAGSAVARALDAAWEAEAPAVVVAAEVVASAAPLTDPERRDDVVAAFETFWLVLSQLRDGTEDPAGIDRAEAVLSAQSLRVPVTVVRAARILHAARTGQPVDRRLARDPRFRPAGSLTQALVALAVARAHDDAAARATAFRLGSAGGFESWLADVAAADPPRSLAGGAIATAEPTPPASAPRPVDRPAPVPTGLSLQVLGGFTLHRGGRLVDLAPLRPRHLELLQVLAVNANRWVHREVLWELLWADRPAEAAAHNLHVAVSAIRRVLEPGGRRGSSVVARSGDRYRLEVLVDDCDVTRFERCLDRAGAARRRGALDEALVELRGAVREWRGEPVPAAGPAEWAVARREEITRRFADAAVDVFASLDPSLESSTVAAHALAIAGTDDLLWHHAMDHAHRVGAVVRLRQLESAYAVLGQRTEATTM
jgi:DNA-binding SARP family transcriptional activator